MVKGFCYNLYSIIITFAGAFGCEWQNIWLGEGIYIIGLEFELCSSF